MVEKISQIFLDDKVVCEFKKLYKKNYEIDLTDQQAVEYGTKLIGLVRAVYGNNLPELDKENGKNNN
ncbi:MAG: hypothetical protein M1120_02150 [Patescibacteria group bacterium]|nr:hypothetical protein [Patescibacteria group bacterium]